MPKRIHRFFQKKWEEYENDEILEFFDNHKIGDQFKKNPLNYPLKFDFTSEINFVLYVYTINKIE